MDEIFFLGQLVIALAPAIYTAHPEASNERIAELALDLAKAIDVRCIAHDEAATS